MDVLVLILAVIVLSWFVHSVFWALVFIVLGGLALYVIRNLNARL